MSKFPGFQLSGCSTTFAMSASTVEGIAGGQTTMILVSDPGQITVLTRMPALTPSAPTE